MKFAIRPCGGNEASSYNGYLDFAKRFTALGICDSSVNFCGDRGRSDENNHKRQKREGSQAIETTK